MRRGNANACLTGMRSISTILFEAAGKYFKANPCLTRKRQWQEPHDLLQEQVFHVWELKNLEKVIFEDSECRTSFSLTFLLL